MGPALKGSEDLERGERGGAILQLEKRLATSLPAGLLGQGVDSNSDARPGWAWRINGVGTLTSAAQYDPVVRHVAHDHVQGQWGGLFLASERYR